MINESFGDVFANCSPETAFVAGLVIALGFGFEILFFSKMLDIAYDGFRWLLKKAIRWFRNRKHS